MLKKSTIIFLLKRGIILLLTFLFSGLVQADQESIPDSATYTLKNSWNWVSFPKLERTDDDPVELAPLLNTMEPMPDQMLVQHRLNTPDNPMTNADFTLKNKIGYLIISKTSKAPKVIK
jgi:hypothetical protein